MNLSKYGLKLLGLTYVCLIEMLRPTSPSVSKTSLLQQRKENILANRYKPLLKSTPTSTSSKVASQRRKVELYSARIPTKKRHVKESGGNARKVKLTGVDIRGNSIRESLPKHLKLKALKVKNPTLCKYKECVDKFMEYASHKRWYLKNVDNTDKKLAEYFAELLESGAPFNTASYTLFGYILLKTDECVADKFLYPRARSALKGWSSRDPQSSRTGADPLIWYLIANHIADKSPPAAAALLLQLDTYARPSEILKAKRRDVIAPASRACKYWGLIFGNSQFSEMTKAKQQDDTVLLDSLDRNYAPKVLKMVASHCAQDDQFLFGPISLAQYEDLFKQSRAAVGLASFSLTPHCVRHSGPSVDFLHRARSATEIQTWGRWKTQKSILRYQKPGQMLARMRKIPKEVWSAAEKALISTMRKLQQHYSTG